MRVSWGRGLKKFFYFLKKTQVAIFG
jgi:hypothetical protein